MFVHFSHKQDIFFKPKSHGSPMGVKSDKRDRFWEFDRKQATLLQKDRIMSLFWSSNNLF